MGVSFKVSKIGRRFVPKPVAGQPGERSPSESSKESSLCISGTPSNKVDTTDATKKGLCSQGLALSEQDVSFTLNLLAKGYFIGKPSEVENFQPLLQDIKSLHPYDRTSEHFFSAIETGRLPGDILDDIPCKYINGAVVCEVRDYRQCMMAGAVAPMDAVPVVNRIRLRMSLENVVKDIPSMAVDSWTYKDLMEVEARILKTLQPKLNLDPFPRLDKLCSDPAIIKLDVDVGRKKRLRQPPEVIITSNNQTHGKKICIDQLPENASINAGDSRTALSNEVARSTLPVPAHMKFQPAVSHPGIMQDHGLSPANYVGINASVSLPQNMIGPYTDIANASVSLNGSRESQDTQMTPISSMKRQRQTVAGIDGIQTQQIPQLGGFNGLDMQWKNQNSHSQIDAKGFQYTNIGGPRLPQMNQESGTSIYFNQQTLRYGPKEEQVDTEKLDKLDMERSKDSLQAMGVDCNTLDQHQLRTQHQAQQPSTRNHLPPYTQWHNSRPSVEKDLRKDDMLKKQKTLPSPRVSSGAMVQSPVSSKSGEISSGSLGGQYNTIAANSALASQMDKVTANSNTAVGAPSVASSPSDSVHRHPQISAPPKRKTNSVPRTQGMSGVGSPASVSNINAPLNAGSPSVGTSSMVDQALIDRFLKIDIVTQRYQLNARKSKVENYPARKPLPYSYQQVAHCLSIASNAEDYTDPINPLSRSIQGGNINFCKTRVITFIRNERFYQVPGRTSSRMIMSEKPYDGTVAMQYGDTDDPDIPTSLDCWQTLPNTHYADLLGAQFGTLMEREGNHKDVDKIFQARPPALVPGMSADNASSDVKHAVPAPLSTAVAPNNGTSPLNSQNLVNNARMLASGSGSQTSPMSQSYLPGPAIPARNQQLDQPLLQQQLQQLQNPQSQLQQLQNPQSQLQQQQQLPLPHIQRSSALLSTNPLSQFMSQNSNIQMGSNTMSNNKPTPMQLQMMQQQQQQQQQQHNQIPRKMMMGLTGLGNVMGSNISGLAGLSNVMGMGGVRGLSSSMGALPGLGAVNPSQMLPSSASTFGAGIRQASLSHAQAAAAMANKIRMAAQQNRAAGMYSSQSGIAGMTGNNNQMLPTSAGLSMLNHALNRANMSPLQPNASMASMGPPKISGPNFYMNQQLQLQQQQRLQQQQQHLQQQQQMQQQQQISSPLPQPQVGSPSVAGSPSPIVMQQMQQQQQISPQQIVQQTPMSPQQFNSGTLQQINNGSMGGAPPASPQLSSQTHGSVGSITSSPMEQLQVVNKGGNSNI